MKTENRVGPSTEPCGTPEYVKPGENGESDTRVTNEGLER